MHPESLEVVFAGKLPEETSEYELRAVYFNSAPLFTKKVWIFHSCSAKTRQLLWIAPLWCRNHLAWETPA